ncbi:DUF937 domain-containing protein [Deinococcus aerophilus]|uniref:DUF937 domain-containing protein n=1 Tax=Deinococcus aerophilus TaxID=522488 RepID=A0ABQ2GP32_9DEIO|nr:DUF937 domain-containing protein [Deinococcus aerophilus]GGM04611.1 hypothetical protein GCM10010841_11260 [Deinococcus aerophilus]
MMDIFNMLGGLGQAQQQVSQQTGATPQQAESALEAAIPLLLGAMTRNATEPQGAAALSGALQQHDGSALDRFQQGALPDTQTGQKILGHVFGNQQQAAANAVGQRAGIDPQLAMRILSLAAPLVLAYLGRQQQGGGQSAGMGNLGSILGGVLGGGSGSGGLGGLLGGLLGGGGSAPQTPTPQSPVPQERGGGVLGGGPVISGLPPQSSPASQAPGGVGGMIGTLNHVLDRDGDGNALNDLIGIFGGRR